MSEDLDKYRKLEPISRVLRALAIPPPEATPKEIMEELGIRTPEQLLAPVKNEIKTTIARIVRGF
jgi:hypothetical protein